MAIVQNLEVLEGSDAPRERIRTSAVVTLVRPALLAPKGGWTTPVTPSLAIAYLAAFARPLAKRLTVVDALGEAIDQQYVSGDYVHQGLTVEQTLARIDPASTLIGVSSMFTQDWPAVRALIEAIRRRFPTACIVAGGEHVTAVPEFCLRDCPELDLCVLGEGEETFAELIEASVSPERIRQVHGIAYLRQGQFIKTSPRNRMRNLAHLPLPAWDLLPMESYVDGRNGHGVYRGRTMGILATRGCPYQCTFCSNPAMYGKAWIPRDVDDVLDEIQHDIDHYGATNIDFYDLTMVVRKKWILDFCRRIEERGMTFTWQLPSGTRSEIIDGDVAAALYRTGCRNLAYAPESGSRRTLELIKKKVNLDHMIDSVRAALRHRIVIRVNLIVGFPHETRADILKTIWFGWKLAVLGVQDAGYYLFSAYPGTALFDELRAEGKIRGFDRAYFQSLLGYKRFFSNSTYCRHVSGLEVAFWRFFGMASYYAFSYALRPWRFLALGWNILKRRSNNAMEQRLGELVRHWWRTWVPQRRAASAAAAPLVETSSVERVA